MEQGRTKRVKTSATRVRRREVGSPSTRDRGDPYYSLILQETRLENFKVANPPQGTVQFLELKGQVYPALNGKYWSMISGNLFELNDDMFMNVGGLSSSGYGIGDCSWVKENFDPAEVYKSFLRGPHLYIQGQLTKVGSLSVENRLLHYIIAYILVQRNTNHAQPIVNDLRFMYVVKNNVMINWPEEILKIMNSVSLSQSKLLPYSIFISRIVDYLHIDVSDTIIVEYTDKDHLVGESLIHKMGIYKYGTTWQYQEDYTTIGLDLSDDDNQGGMGDQHATTQGEPSGTAPHNSVFGLDQLEAMEQRLNNRMEQYEERQPAYSDNQFQELRNMIQSTAEAQNAMFCSEFQKLSVLIRGDQNSVIPVDHIDDPPPPPQP
ncbi:hypothetical protein Lal_00027246 [Lupinus albus]|nr:hypothetical protein Lal_00027246 [Lupinus albus]